MATFTVTTTSDTVDENDGLVSLREAVTSANAAAGADTIEFASGVGDAFETGGLIRLTSGAIELSDEVTIDGGGRVTITGDANANDALTTDASGNQITDVPNNTNTSDNTGVLTLSGGPATLQGLVITGGYAINGAGVAIGANQSLTVIDSSISGNASTGTSANNGGGAIRGGNTSTLYLQNALIQGNSAESMGGGVRMGGNSTLVVDNSQIQDNIAGVDGGGLRVGTFGELRLENSQLLDNEAGRVGGGLHIQSDGVALIDNTSIERNAAVYGGGVRTGGRTDLTITNSDVIANSAVENGGGVYAGGYSTFTARLSTISENAAGSKGGGIFSNVGSTTNIAATTISSNTAQYGAGITFYSSDYNNGFRQDAPTHALISSSLFYKNEASNQGGGIFAFSDNFINITQTSFVQNYGIAGSAIRMRSIFTEELIIEGSVFTGNVGFDIISPQIFGSSFRLSNSIITGNSGDSLGSRGIGSTDLLAPSVSDLSGISPALGGATAVVAGTAEQVFAETTLVNGVLAGVLADNGGPVRTVALRAGLDNPALGIASIEAIPADLADADGDGDTTEPVPFDANGDSRLTFETRAASEPLPLTGFRAGTNPRSDAGAADLIGPIIVTTTQDVVDPDDGEMSLREAIQIANLSGGTDFIEFADGAGEAFENGGLIRLTQGELTIEEGFVRIEAAGNVTITGDANGDDALVAGTDLTDVPANLVLRDGGDDRLDDNTRVFSGNLTRATALELVGLTVTGGVAGSGGGISVAYLGLIDSTLHGNAAIRDGTALGGGFVAGGLFAAYSTISGNAAVGTTDAQAGGGQIDGILLQNKQAKLQNTTFADNYAIAGTGSASGGGLVLLTGGATITNSTFTGNAAIGENEARGGGIVGGIGSIENSIISGNAVVGATTSVADVDPNAPIQNSLIGTEILNGTTVLATVSPDQVFAETRDNNGVVAGVLADNGGPVQTVALLNSNTNPVLDAGDVALLQETSIGVDLNLDGDLDDASTLDAQGNARVFGASVDLGAVEVALSPPSDGDDLLTGSDGPDTVAGEDGSDVILTGDGDDAATGGADPDALAGQDGNDTLDGGEGNDILSGGAGADLIYGGEDDDFVVGGAEDDQIFGGTGADTLQGDAGNDTLDGGPGDDRYQLVDELDTLVERVAEGYDRAFSETSVTLGDHVEAGNLLGVGNLSMTAASTGSWLNGNAGNNTLLGQDGADRLDGNAGDDVLDGAGGNDILEGGLGADTFALSDGIDIILDFENGTDLIDLTGFGLLFSDLNVSQSGANVALGHGSGTLIVNNAQFADLSAADFIEPLTSTPRIVTGTEGDDNLSQATGPIEIQGLGGNDLLRAFTGSATLVGGIGDDQYYVYEDGTVITETADEGTDLVRTQVDLVLSANVENASEQGTAGVDITGNALDNAITGSAGSNVLSGGAGNDRLRGRDGADTLDGGTGNDILEGGTADGATDIFVFELGDGTDIVRDFELGVDILDLTATGLNFTDLTISGTANALVNYGVALILVEGVTAAQLTSDQFEFGE